LRLPDALSSRGLVGVGGVALLTASIVSLLAVSTGPQTNLTVFLAYAGGMAMFVTP
jgi:hypothetical protein